MTENKPMTIKDLKEVIKNLPDDVPLYMDDEHEVMEILSFRKDSVALWNPEDNDDAEVFVEALIFGVA